MLDNTKTGEQNRKAYRKYLKFWDKHYHLGQDQFYSRTSKLKCFYIKPNIISIVRNQM